MNNLKVVAMSLRKDFSNERGSGKILPLHTIFTKGYFFRLFPNLF